MKAFYTTIILIATLAIAARLVFGYEVKKAAIPEVTVEETPHV